MVSQWFDLRGDEETQHPLCQMGRLFFSDSAVYLNPVTQRHTSLTWYWTVSCMAPRWTGMCGALDTKPPSGPNTAQEKSRRSLMLVEMEVLWRTRPICSAVKEEWNETEQDRIPALRLLCLIPQTLHSYLLCSWSGGRRWRAAQCWAQCRGHSDGQSLQSYKHRRLLSDEPHSLAPPGWYWWRKERDRNIHLHKTFQKH